MEPPLRNVALIGAIKKCSLALPSILFSLTVFATDAMSFLFSDLMAGNILFLLSHSIFSPSFFYFVTVVVVTLRGAEELGVPYNSGKDIIKNISRKRDKSGVYKRIASFLFLFSRLSDAAVTSRRCCCLDAGDLTSGPPRIKRERKKKNNRLCLSPDAR